MFNGYSRIPAVHIRYFLYENKIIVDTAMQR